MKNTIAGARRRPGYTLLEIMAVVVILTILAVKAAPRMAALLDKSKAAECLANRTILERAEERYRLDHGDQPSASLDALYQARYIDRAPKCSSRGQYIWISTAAPVNMGCTVHDWPTASPPSPLTPLGSTFSEITGNMIALMQNFFNTNGRWPRSFGDYRYTDLGLNPADWSGVAYDGFIYGAGGNRISIKSGSGWQISVTGVDGVNRVVNPAWDLWYDIATSQWYYHTITPASKIDISTLQIKRL